MPQPLARDAHREGAGGSGPEARRPPSDHKPEALVEGVAHRMKLRRTTGLVAGLLTLGLLAGPAVAAGPANVTLRVEGTNQTLVPRTALTTIIRQVNKDGIAGHDCTGTSAFGAVDQAAAGDIGAHWTSLLY